MWLHFFNARKYYIYDCLSCYPLLRSFRWRKQSRLSQKASLVQRKKIGTIVSDKIWFLSADAEKSIFLKDTDFKILEKWNVSDLFRRYCLSSFNFSFWSANLSIICKSWLFFSSYWSILDRSLAFSLCVLASWSRRDVNSASSLYGLWLFLVST